jgi:DNA-binding beta-propeller fold protein YncE
MLIPISIAGPHGLDLDQENDRAFVACDGNAVVVLDLESDREVGTVPITGVPDAIWYNPSRKRRYVAIGDPGVVDVVNTGTLSVDQQVVSAKGAHTTAYDDKRQLLTYRADHLDHPQVMLQTAGGVGDGAG